MPTGDDFKRWCKRYDAEVSRSSTSYRRAINSPVQFYNLGDIEKMSLRIDDVPMLNVHIPEDKFNDVVYKEMVYDKQQQNYDRLFNEYGIAKRFMDDAHAESIVRQRSPAAQKAYEQYRLILALEGHDG